MNALIFYNKKLNTILSYFLIFFLFNLYSLSAKATYTQQQTALVKAQVTATLALAPTDEELPSNAASKTIENILTIFKPLYSLQSENIPEDTTQSLSSLIHALAESFQTNPITTHFDYAILLRLIQTINPRYDISSILTPNKKNTTALRTHLQEAFEPIYKKDGFKASLEKMILSAIKILLELLTNCSTDSALTLDKTPSMAYMEIHLQSYAHPSETVQSTSLATNQAQQDFYKTLQAEWIGNRPVLSGLTCPLQQFSLYNAYQLLNKTDSLSIKELTGLLDSLRHHFLSSQLSCEAQKSLKKNQESLLQLPFNQQELQLKRALAMNSLTALILLPGIPTGKVYLKLIDDLTAHDPTDNNMLLANLILHSIAKHELYICKLDRHHAKIGKPTSVAWGVVSKLIPLPEELELKLSIDFW